VTAGSAANTLDGLVNTKPSVRAYSITPAEASFASAAWLDTGTTAIRVGAARPIEAMATETRHNDIILGILVPPK